MAETKQGSDLGTGLSVLFGLIVILASIATATAAFLSETQGSDTMQILSAVGLTVALVAAGLAVAVIHLYE